MESTLPQALTVARLPELVGRQFAPCAWIDVTRERILAFADCTNDHQYIHVDPARVQRETPWPDVLAHGYLLLSFAARAAPPDFPQITDLQLVLNYGIDRLRFVSPVTAGSRVRYRIQVTGAESRADGRMLLKREVRLEVESREQPALVATLLALYVPRASGGSDNPT